MLCRWLLPQHAVVEKSKNPGFQSKSAWWDHTRLYASDIPFPKKCAHERRYHFLFLRDAVRDGLGRRDTAALVRWVSVSPPTTRTWGFDEAQQLLIPAHDHWLWPLFALTLALGPNQGEAQGSPGKISASRRAGGHPLVAAACVWSVAAVTSEIEAVSVRSLCRRSPASR